MSGFATASTDVSNAIYAAAAKYGIDPAYLFTLGNNETGLNGVNPPRGSAGEYGTFQILPSNVAALGYSEDPTSPNYIGSLQNNANAAAKLVSQLEESSSDPSTIFANYNQGAASIAAHGIAKSTQTYVANALAGLQHYAQGFTPSPSPTPSPGPTGTNTPAPDATVTPSSTSTPGGPTAWQKFVAGFSQGQDTLNAGPLGAGEAFAGSSSGPGSWLTAGIQGYISGLVGNIEADFLLGGLALALVAGGFALLAADNKQVRTVAVNTAKGIAAA